MIAALIGLWLAMLLARGTPLGEAMHRLLVEAPAHWLSRWRRGDVALLLIALLVIAGVGYFLEHDGLAMLAMGAPELASWLMMFEVSAWLDALITVTLVASALRGTALRSWIAARQPRRSAGKRRVRARRVRRARPPANDDEDGALPLAA